MLDSLYINNLGDKLIFTVVGNPLEEIHVFPYLLRHCEGRALRVVGRSTLELGTNGDGNTIIGIEKKYIFYLIYSVPCTYFCLLVS